MNDQTRRAQWSLTVGLLVVLSLLAIVPATFAQTTQTIENGCMEEAAGFALNCTANDVQLAGVATDPITGEPMLEILDDGCAFPGDTVTFSATFEVVLTAQARHDIGVYFATDGDPDGDGAVTGACTISTVPYFPEPDFLDLDGFGDGGHCANDSTRSCEKNRDCRPVGGDCLLEQDTCGDIDNSHNPLLPVITITTECIDPDGNRTLNLPNCTSWRQPGANELCTGPLDAYPGAPSKCRCDIGFEVPIDVPPAELLVEKSANPTSVDEPGDSVTFDVSVTNLSPYASVTLTELADDEDNDGIDDVVYDPAIVCAVTLLGPGESTTCQFTRTVNGNAGDLKVDVATITGTDSEGNTVSGSDDATVEITDVPAVPLTVVKSVTSAASLPEPGGDFDFLVVVTNGSTVDTATVTDLDDTFLADLQVNGSCADADGDVDAPWELSPGESMSCAFTVEHLGNPATFDNQVAVAATDDDGADVGAVSNTVTVEITDVPPAASLVKTAVSAAVTYQVVVKNDSAAESLTLDALTDDRFGSLTDVANPLLVSTTCSVPKLLQPAGTGGDTYSCSFVAVVNAADSPHTNTATGSVSDDDAPTTVTPSDSATVELK